eukprot:3915864-Amphidinium_carterae.1
MGLHKCNENTAARAFYLALLLFGATCDRASQMFRRPRSAFQVLLQTKLPNARSDNELGAPKSTHKRKVAQYSKLFPYH